jgi:hypothetical protein
MKYRQGEVRLCYLFSSENIPPGAVRDSLGVLLGVNIRQQNYYQQYCEPLILLGGSQLILSATCNGSLPLAKNAEHTLAPWTRGNDFTKAHCTTKKEQNKTNSVASVYRPSHCSLSAKLVKAFADRGCHVVVVAYPYGCNMGFFDQSSYFSFKVAPQFYSRGWVDPIPDPFFSENLVAPRIEPGPLDL